ncbi:hypothetical protein KYB31_18920 [Clostridium felsineum]|uniref:hypothetical protein n=1 Tax=Clostridium felsineum TaxID=36839 RepID=UPI00098C0A04|nr:hypothetical protein [Clostridium felsineum]MCR3761051.1 hypothetical protein [Clostridium felsineum]URZ04321.1 hypothetical protein CLAUR_044100 [Clostridium felsineum]URZ17158.1 hypothetical protein CLFE_032100 [Clostridium felsineum DSM 794]
MENVIEEIIDILNLVKPQKELYTEKNFDVSLTGKLMFSAVDMVYVFLEVQKHFNIKLEAVDLESYKFNSINGIKEAVLRAIK